MWLKKKFSLHYQYISKQKDNISTKGYCSIEKQLLYAIIKKDV